MTERFSEQELDRWRTVADEPADELARAMLTAYRAGGSGTGEPGATVDGVDHVDEVAVLGRAVQDVLAAPPSHDDDVGRWLLGGPALPDWADDELIAAGQRFFAKWPLPIATALFCASLPTAYAAPRGAAVMEATSLLGERRAVARRLAGTGYMIFDVMDPTTVLRLQGGGGEGGEGGEDSAAGGGALPLHPGSQAHLTVRSVRLLHALVRQSLLAGGDSTWPPGTTVPINQEELVGTLLTFTVTVLDGLERLGIPVTPAEAAAYLHSWCVVGSVLGIDERLLPLTLDEARAAAKTIAGRQLGPSEAGTALAGELLAEMRLAMPVGCQGLPAALVHRLVPDIAALLRLPSPSPVWRVLVDRGCELIRSCREAPSLRGLVAAGPGAAVGRSVLQLYMDRQEQAGAPDYRVAPGELLRKVRGRGGWRRVARRTARRQRRGDVIGTPAKAGPGGVAATVITLPASVALPIDAADVRAIATEGFTLWERREVLVERNRRITVAYADLSRELARLLAAGRGPDSWDANWCTFASWSSRTIGTFIEKVPDRGAARPTPAGPADAVARAPGPLSAEALTLRSMQRTDGAAFRTLAAGNRVVFLEIGLAVATFLDRIKGRIDDEAEREAQWEAFCEAIAGQLATFATLDESWLLTAPPDPRDLYKGLHEYLVALHTDDPHERSQHVLAGNLLLAAYEQRRVDAYVAAALALFTKRAMRRLVCERAGHLSGFRRWANQGFALLLTRRMELHLPNGEVLAIDEPVPTAPRTADRWPELATDDGVTLPLLQALITRFDLEERSGAPPDGCRNWTSFEQRMRTIGRLFRLRQRQRDLFGDPFATGESGD